MEVEILTKNFDPEHVLDTVEGEICFFRALMRSRPVGMHRHFHVLSMKHAIEQGTGQAVSVDAIWHKLRSCYNLEALEALEAENEGQGSNASTPDSIPSPSPSQNLAMHPFFRAEFTLPSDEVVDNMIMTRRLRATASLPSSPTPVPTPSKKRRRRATSEKVDMAGLINGDSDSSALTQESIQVVSGHDSQTPVGETRASVDTGTDAGTEDLVEEENNDDTSKTKRNRKTRPRSSTASQTKNATVKKKKK